MKPHPADTSRRRRAPTRRRRLGSRTTTESMYAGLMYRQPRTRGDRAARARGRIRRPRDADRAISLGWRAERACDDADRRSCRWRSDEAERRRALWSLSFSARWRSMRLPIATRSRAIVALEVLAVPPEVQTPELCLRLADASSSSASIPAATPFHWSMASSTTDPGGGPRRNAHALGDASGSALRAFTTGVSQRGAYAISPGEFL